MRSHRERPRRRQPRARPRQPAPGPAGRRRRRARRRHPRRPGAERERAGTPARFADGPPVRRPRKLVDRSRRSAAPLGGRRADVLGAADRARGGPGSPRSGAPHERARDPACRREARPGRRHRRRGAQGPPTRDRTGARPHGRAGRRAGSRAASSTRAAGAGRGAETDRQPSETPSAPPSDRRRAPARRADDRSRGQRDGAGSGRRTAGPHGPTRAEAARPRRSRGVVMAGRRAERRASPLPRVPAPPRAGRPQGPRRSEPAAGRDSRPPRGRQPESPRLRAKDPWLALIAIEGRTGYADRALALARYYRAARTGPSRRVSVTPEARKQLESGLVDRRLIAVVGYI